MYESIPKGLQEKGLFCLWRYEERKGKTAKVPYRINGSHASSTDKRTFTDFNQAVNAVNAYDGMGIGIFDDICAVDIDHCITDGKPNDMAQDIIDRMDSYTEISPSGSGVHIIFYVRDLEYDPKRYYINNRKIGLEVYVAKHTNKFVTVTGNVIRECNAGERSEALLSVLEKYMVRTPTEPEKVTQTVGSYLSDESIISKASASGQKEKFLSLWNGDIAGYASNSEADLALCFVLAFWCGGDTGQMDRLFRQSKLYREKWERDDYRESTLEKAVSFVTEFYKPISVSNAADDFNKILPILKKLEPVSDKRYDGGDIGFGRLFADVYRDIARFVPERKKWFVYDGKRWVSDIGSLRAMELCKDVADALLLYILTIQNEGIRTRYLEQCRKWQQRRFREIYLKEAQSIYPIAMTEFDQNKYLLNCNNGTLDLNTMNFREHRPNDLLTKMCPVNYDPNAVSERFARFIDEIMSGDKEKANFLQKALGYGISGDTRYECMFFLYGELTRNGKGTLMESCLYAVGDYGLSVRPETIAQKKNSNSQSPSEDVARLSGIRFANISDPSRGLVLNAAQVKSMTGNDTLNARFLNESSFDFKPQFKLYVNTNYLPVISDTTLFSSGRVVIIPFSKHFEEYEQDKTLKEEFAKPETQSAILNWLVEGYRKLKTEGLRQPQSVLDATLAYSHESDKIAQFAEERLIQDDTFEVRTSAIYEEYRGWCGENGCYTENSRNFNHELRKFGTVVRRRPRTGGEKTTLLIGYRLNANIKPLFYSGAERGK